MGRRAVVSLPNPATITYFIAARFAVGGTASGSTNHQHTGTIVVDLSPVRLARRSGLGGVVCAQIFSGRDFTPTFFAADRSSLSSVARGRFVRIANSR